MTISTEKVLRWIIIGCVLFVPFIVLIVTNTLFFPYIVGKGIIFRVLTESMLAAWIPLAIMDASYRPRWRPVFISFAVLLGIALAANAFGENPYKGFWSNYERMDGLVTLLHLFAYTVIASVVFVKEDLWLWFWRISLGVSTLVTLKTLQQLITTDKIRLDSTLGNPIYLAEYAFFHIFIALILATRRGASRIEIALYTVVLLPLFPVLYLTASRGAMLGTLAGFLLASIGIAVTYRSEKMVRIIAIIVGTTVVLGGLLFITQKNTPFVQQSPVLKRFASLSLHDDSIFARTAIWGMAIRGIRDRPIRGWGQEGFNFVFNKYYDPKMYNLEPWYDRTHNVILDWAVTTGIPGLLAYLAMLFFFIRMVYRTKKYTIVQKWIIAGLFTAYTIHNLTVFDQLISYILFFSLLAWLVTIRESERHTPKEIQKVSTSTVPVHPIVAVILVVLVAGTLIVTINKAPLVANKLLLGGLQEISYASGYGQAKDTAKARAWADKSLRHLTKATSIHSYGAQEASEQLVQTASKIANKAWMTQEMKQAWYSAGMKAIFNEEKKVPNDARFPVFLAGMQSAFGQLPQENKTLLRAHALSPQKQTILLNLASNELRQGNTKKASEYAKQGYVLAPDFNLAQVVYASTLLVGNEQKTFKTIFGESKTIGANARILFLLISKKEYTTANTLWKRAFVTSKNTKIAFMLVQIYAEKGDKVRATKALNAVLAIDPRLGSYKKQALTMILNGNNKIKDRP